MICLTTVLVAQYTPDFSTDLIEKEGDQFTAQVAYQLCSSDADRHILLTINGQVEDFSADHFGYLVGFIAWNLKSFFDQSYTDAAQQAFWPDYDPDQVQWSIVSRSNLQPDLQIAFFLSKEGMRYRIKFRDFYVSASAIPMPQLPFKGQLAQRNARGFSKVITQKPNEQAYPFNYLIKAQRGISRSYFCFMLGVLDTENYAANFSAFFPSVPPLPMTLSMVWDDESIYRRAIGIDKGSTNIIEQYGITMSAQYVTFESHSEAGEFSFSVTYDDLLNDFESF